MSTAAPEDMGEASVVTPHSPQEFKAPTSDSIDTTSAPAAPAMKSLPESANSVQSATPSSELVVDGGDGDTHSARLKGLNPAASNRRMDKVVEDMRVHRDELDKENEDLKTQIQQLKLKIRDVKMLDRTLSAKEDSDQMKEEWEEEYEFRSWGATHNTRERGMPFRQNRRRSRREQELGHVSHRFETKMRQKQNPQTKKRTLHLDSSGLSDSLDDLEQADEGEAEYREPQTDDTPSSTPRLNRVAWVAFQESIEMMSEADRSAIDVLVGEPDLTQVIDRSPLPPTGRRRGEGLAAAAVGQRRMPGKPSVRGQLPLPERIRINSKAILKILSKIHKEDLSSDLAPVLMMQPFRALVCYKDEVWKWQARLEARFGEPHKTVPKSETSKVTDGDADGDSNATDTHEYAKTQSTGNEIQHRDVQVNIDEDDGGIVKDDNEETNKVTSEETDEEADEEDDEGFDKEIDEDPHLNQRAALDDLNCLIELIEDLEDKLAYIASNECQRVSFSDIWYLFKPGDLVLSKDEKQAYRVVDVKFSTHRMKLPSARDIWMFNAKAKLEDSPITIQCVYIDFDGEQIGPVSQTFAIYRFDGEKNIRSLDIIPLRLAKKGDLETTLIKRGSTFIEACDTQRRGVPMHYSGLTLETREEVDSQVVIDFEEAFAANGGGGSTKFTGWTVEKLVIEAFAESLKDDGKLFVWDTPTKWKPVIKNIERPEETQDVGRRGSLDSDSEASFRHSNKCIPECCSNEIVHDDTYVERNRSNDFIQSQLLQQGMTSNRVPSLAIAPRSLKEATEDEGSITDDERLIITYRVFGFIMRSRKWAKLDLTYLGPTKGENTFDLLVLPPGHRRMVESLVTQHFLDKESASDETDEVDIVRGKGKGLILLLHGAPGVGKTTTAECVATYFHKPLFQITCGDLGSTADVVESRLETNFALASRWGCILLIDEADVFLEARQTENFDRNSLVAVFLRALEYYTGILFLTTNRVGTFDEAFTSRIHISLYYPPLSQASTLAVFKVNLTRIKERFKKKKERGQADLELDECSIDEFILRYYAQHKEARWNGRQIRNACQTALALAEFEAQKLANPGVAGGRNVMELAGATKKMINVQLTAKHFHDVAKAYLAFMRYLKEVHGVSAAQQAKNFRLRHDRYGLGEPASLLASRQRHFEADRGPTNWRRANTGGSGARNRPGGQQGWGKTGHQRRQDEYMDDLDEYMYGEEDLYGQENDADPLQNEEDEAQLEGDSRYERQDEYYENEDDGANLAPFEDEKDADNYVEELEDEQFYDDNEYDYGARPTARSRPGPTQTGRRGQQAMSASTGALAGEVRHGKRVGVGAGTGRSLGPSERVSSGSHPSPGRGKAPAGAAPGGQGQGRRVNPRHKT